MGGIKTMITEAQASLIRGILVWYQEIKLDAIVQILNSNKPPNKRVTASAVKDIVKGKVFPHIKPASPKTTAKHLTEYIFRKANVDCSELIDRVCKTA